MNWIAWSGALGALAVAAGAFGAHALERHVDARMIDIWRTAAHYHLVHAAALLALALFAVATGRSVAWPAGLFLAGISIFSGSLYLLVLTGQRWLGAVTPLGGVALIAGWIAVALLARGAR